MDFYIMWLLPFQLLLVLTLHILFLLSNAYGYYGLFPSTSYFYEHGKPIDNTGHNEPHIKLLYTIFQVMLLIIQWLLIIGFWEYYVEYKMLVIFLWFIYQMTKDRSTRHETVTEPIQ